jgi:hypothetical protein
MKIFELAQWQRTPVTPTAWLVFLRDLEDRRQRVGMDRLGGAAGVEQADQHLRLRSSW